MAVWADDKLPRALADLERWATDVAKKRGLAQKVSIEARFEVSAVNFCTPEHIGVFLDRRLIEDTDFVRADLKAVIAHEVGHCWLRLTEYSTLSPKDREYAADGFSADVLGPQAAISAIRRTSAWYATHNEPWSDEGPTHPSAGERICRLELLAAVRTT